MGGPLSRQIKSNMQGGGMSVKDIKKVKSGRKGYCPDCDKVLPKGTKKHNC